MWILEIDCADLNSRPSSFQLCPGKSPCLSVPPFSNLYSRNNNDNNYIRKNVFTLVSRHRKWVQHDVEHTPFILASIRRTNNLTGGTQNSTVFFLFFFFSSFLPWSIKHSIFGQWNLEPFLQTFGKLYLFCKSCPNAHMSSELERPGESNSLSIHSFVAPGLLEAWLSSHTRSQLPSSPKRWPEYF